MGLLPRDQKFFDLFISVAELSVEAAKLQLDLLRADGYHRGAIVDAIKRLEHEADQITHEVVTRLDRVFITRSTGRTSTCWHPGSMTWWT
jgi:hypothetical protein